MRFSRALDYLPVPSNLKLFYSRITTSRLTTIYFLAAVLHCCLQVTFQVAAFKINEYAGRFLGQIIQASGIITDHAVMDQNELKLCGPNDWDSDDIYACPVVWRAKTLANEVSDAYDIAPVVPISTPIPSRPTVDTFPLDTIDDDDEEDRDDDDNDDVSPVTRTVTEFVQASQTASTNPRLNRRQHQITTGTNENGTSTVQISNFQVKGAFTDDVELELSCVEMLIWPRQTIRNTKREDITFIGFQVWVLGMSVVAILNESIPHVLASLLTHLLATTWSGYQLYNTALFRTQFLRSTIQSDRCGGINLLPDYWQQRNAAEIGVLVVNGVSLLAMSFFSWKLVKAFGWQTFKRIGASLDINRVYKIVLTFSIGLQLASFFIVASMVLWLDFLVTSPLGRRAQGLLLYQILAIVSCVLIIPWLCFGWFAVRREAKAWMGTFIAVSCLMIAGWAAMFLSRTFRWTFIDWRFFSVMSTASSTLLLLTTILGLLCFMNFGKGLKRFLSGQEPLEEAYQPPTSPKDLEKAEEKVEFPISGPIPTYTLAFGGARSTTSPTDRRTSSHYLGHNPTYMQGGASVARAPSNGSSHSSESKVSDTSNGRSYASAGSHHALNNTSRHHRDMSEMSGNAKKGWVIE